MAGDHLPSAAPGKPDVPDRVRGGPGFRRAVLLFVAALHAMHGGVARAQMPSVLSDPGARPLVSGVLLEPEGGGTHPGIVLLHGSGGWRPESLEAARALTDSGFVTLTLDYYAETGGAPIGSKEKLEKWPTWQRSVRAAVQLLGGLPSVGAKPVGLLGYSRGAFLAVSVAGSIPRVRAVVDVYGGGGGGTSSLPDEVRQLPPILILHGDADDIVPVRFARELHDACLAAGRTAELYVYSGVGHGFTIPGFATYSGDAADDVVRRSIAFFRRWLETP
jgi:carboxymethylenebutenolidase